MRQQDSLKHSEVTQICNLLYRRLAVCRRLADYKSAIQQIANLRYVTDPRIYHDYENTNRKNRPLYNDELQLDRALHDPFSRAWSLGVAQNQGAGYRRHHCRRAEDPGRCRLQVGRVLCARPDPGGAAAQEHCRNVWRTSRQYWQPDNESRGLAQARGARQRSAEKR